MAIIRDEEIALLVALEIFEFCLFFDWERWDENHPDLPGPLGEKIFHSF
jgi:hypothetical protein